MTLNLDALERAAIAGTIKWRDAHSLVSLARKLLRLRSAARDFYNSTVANPNLRLSANDKKTRDEAMGAGERLRTLLESTVPGGEIAELGKPFAWVRFRSDGGIEGPILDTDPRICDTRRSFWIPLHLGQTSTPDAMASDTEIERLDRAENTTAIPADGAGNSEIREST